MCYVSEYCVLRWFYDVSNQTQASYVNCADVKVVNSKQQRTQHIGIGVRTVQLYPPAALLLHVLPATDRVTGMWILCLRALPWLCCCALTGAADTIFRIPVWNLDPPLSVDSVRDRLYNSDYLKVSRGCCNLQGLRLLSALHHVARQFSCVVRYL